MENTKNKTSFKERLLYLKELTNLYSTKDFANRFNLSFSTLRHLEYENISLTHKTASKISHNLALNGISCSVEWLLGKENAEQPSIQKSLPSIKDEYNVLNIDISELRTRNIATSHIIEADVFKQLNPNSHVTYIMDDAMVPFYKVGDYVGGIALDLDNIGQKLSCPCIIQTKDNIWLVRHVTQPKPNQKLFNVRSLNMDTYFDYSFEKEVELSTIAPIIWHRIVKAFY